MSEGGRKGPQGRTNDESGKSGKYMNKEAEVVTAQHRGCLFFAVKDLNLFHRVNIIGNIFTSRAATNENTPDDVHEMR